MGYQQFGDGQIVEFGDGSLATFGANEIGVITPETASGLNYQSGLMLLDIINTALISLGAPPVQSINEETTQARIIKAVWNLSLRAVLRAHPWNFAISRKILAPLTTPPAFGFGQVYALPEDWIRTLSAEADSYKQEGRFVLCDVPGALPLRYVRFVNDPTLFDASFCDALAAHLAFKAAYPLTQSSTQQDLCWKAYDALLRLARSIDAQEDTPDEFEVSSLIYVRR